MEIAIIAAMGISILLNIVLLGTVSQLTGVAAGSIKVEDLAKALAAAVAFFGDAAEVTPNKTDDQIAEILSNLMPLVEQAIDSKLNAKG